MPAGAPLPLDMTLPASPDRSSTRAESLSPASSSSSSITDLASRLCPSSASAAAIQAAKDADAKSSALKALAGIGKVVSRSRQVDAEALQAIKLQRAKVKAEGGPGSVGSHRHTRTLSTESLPSLPEVTGTSLPSNMPATGGAGSASGGGGGGGGFSTPTSSSMMPPPPSRGHRRSHSGIPLSGGSGNSVVGHHHLAGGGNAGTAPSSHLQGCGVMPPRTSPRSYSDLLSGLGLADLLALQTAVDNEIQTQLSAAGLTPLTMGIGASPTGTHSPQYPADVLLSAQYASAVLASQKQQQVHASARALQQALAGVASGMGFNSSTSTSTIQQQQQQQQDHHHQQQRTQYPGSLGHSPIYGRSPKKEVPPFSSSGSGGSTGGLPHDDHSHHSRSRSIDVMLHQHRSSSPLTPDSGSSGGLTAAASSTLSFGGLEGAGGFHMDLTGMEDFVGGPQPPPTARSLDVGAPQPPREPISAAFPSTDFSFLGASGSSLLVAPEGDVAPSPFTRSSSGSLGQQTLLQQHKSDENAAREQQQQQQQLPLLFGNLQLGSLDPWR